MINLILMAELDKCFSSLRNTAVCSNLDDAQKICKDIHLSLETALDLSFLDLVPVQVTTEFSDCSDDVKGNFHATFQADSGGTTRIVFSMYSNHYTADLHYLALVVDVFDEDGSRAGSKLLLEPGLDNNAFSQAFAYIGSTLVD